MISHDSLHISACQNFFCFTVRPPINIGEIVLPKNFKIIRDKDSAIIAIEVNVYGTEDSAKKEAQEQIRKLLAILSLHGNQKSNAEYKSCRRLHSDGKQEIIIESALNISSSLSVRGNEPVNLSKVVSRSDKTFWRQTGHFERGNSTEDPVERFREYYQVLEEEGKGQITFTEKSLRHAVNHSHLDNKETIAEVVKVLGAPYFDPLNDNHKSVIKTYANELRRRALTLLLSKSATP